MSAYIVTCRYNKSRCSWSESYAVLASSPYEAVKKVTEWDEVIMKEDGSYSKHPFWLSETADVMEVSDKPLLVHEEGC